MNTRAALLGSFLLSLLLTGCPLTDHYQLMSADAGSSAAGADEAGSDAGGATTLHAGTGGTNGRAGAPAGGESAGGEAGEPAISGAPNAGGGGELEIAGAPAGGASMAGGAGASAGSAGAAGAPSGCVGGCTVLQTCCISSCVDLSSDPANCGACGTACNAPRLCASSACKTGWIGMSAPPAAFVPRSRAAVVAMDKSVFYWGGQDGFGNALDTGAIYDPTKDKWTYLPKDPGAPVARMMASAVWTGKVVIVFGGTDASGNAFRDGAVYDPSATSWIALPANAAVSRRSAPIAFWDGTRAFFWGGLSSMGFAVSNADRFDLTNWSISANAGDPGALLYPAVGFDGAVMYVMGGQLGNNRQDKVYSYAASTDTWTAVPKSALSPRSAAFGVWDGAHFVVWGGRDDNFGLRSDGSYLSGTKWTALSNFGAPSARMIAFRRSGWGFQSAPGVIAIVGGQVSTNAAATLTTTGAYYTVATSSWTAIPSWPSGEAHEYGMGVWTGQEFVLWGGRDNNGVTSTGERWAP